MSRNLNNINTSVRSLNNLEKNNLAGINLNKIGNTINLDTDLINLDTINTFKIDLTLNNEDNQFLVKSISYTDGDILQIDSNNKLNKITVNSILGNIVGGTNITKTNNTLDLDSNLTNLSTINTFKIGLSAISNDSTLLRNSALLSNGDYLQINSDGYVEGVSLIENKNAILGSDNTSGIIAGTNITKTVDVPTGNITLTSTNTTYTAGTNINLSGTAINLDTNLTNLSLINTFKIGLSAISNASTLLRNSEVLSDGDYLQINSSGYVVGKSIKETKNIILGTDNTSGIIPGTNITKTVDVPTGNITLTSTNTTYTGGTNISISGTNINLDSNITLDRINMTQGPVYNSNGNPIFFKGNNDVNHYIKYVFDGVQIGGYGSGNAPCFQVVNTQPLNDDPPGTPTPVFQVYIDKVITKQKLNMTSQPIYFKDDDVNHYIKYQSTGDCVELASYSDGADDDVVFQFINKAVSQDNNLVLFNKENNSFVKTTNFESDIIIKNAKKIIFNDSSVVTQSNYIKFNDTYDSMEISGSGLGGTASVLRIVSVNSTPDVLADFELTKTTFEKATHFNNDIHMASEKKLSFDVDSNNWMKATTADSQDGLHINGKTGIKLSTGTYASELFLNQNTFEVSVNLTTFYNNITATNCDIALEGDFVGTNCNLTIDGDMRVGTELNMRDNDNLGIINMANGAIYWRNGYKTGEDTYAIDRNHYTQYNTFPVDGVLIHGWNGVSLGYTNGGPGTALYTSQGGVYFGNGTPVSSDDRIKFNESKITDALSTINKLVVVEYDKKYNRDLPETQYGEEMENHLLNDTPQVEYGYIAQDTYNNIPELRFTIKGVDETIPENFDEDGKLIEDCRIRNSNSDGKEFIDRKYLSIDYNNINVLNVRAVQELSEIVSQQQEQINKQQEIINTLINSTTFANFKKNI